MAQNRPIVTENKAKRIDMGELIYQNCWAFMRELRTHNKTKTVYSVDPYAEVYRFRENTYGIFSPNYDGGGDPWSYLVIGPEKAMLIDTGCGVGDLKGLVQEIIGNMELIVVNTHPHPDHCGGNSQFERVYLLEADAEGIKRGMARPFLSDRVITADGKCRMVEFDFADIIERKEYEVVPIPDGYLFDLGGGYIVETIMLAGHAAGQAAYLDRQTKCLFCGDDIIGMRVSVYGDLARIIDFRDRMAKLAGRIDEIEGIFPGHFVTDLDNTSILCMLDALNRIVEDPENYDYIEERAGHGTTYCKAVLGLGAIGYSAAAFAKEENK